MRENIFPNNDKYLKNINNISISFNDKPELSNLSLCYKYVQITNNNKLEKYIIFTTILLLNILFRYTQIHIDGTFKACPKGFYQIIIISQLD